MRVNGETPTGSDARDSRERARGDPGASAPDDVAAALEVVRSRAGAMASMPGMGWTGDDSSLAGAAAFFGGRALGQELGPETVGIVGGASSGKSTLFNNLVAGDGPALHTSLVTMRAHTTRGPVAATSVGDTEAFRLWVTREGWGGWGGTFGAEVALAEPDGRTTGDERRMTMVRTGHAGLEGMVLVDTPDLTSLAAKDAGDITRVMLPWLDRVLVVVDEDRWFDDQVFGWLAGRLAEVAPEADRLVVFNRTQRSAVEAPTERGREEREVLARRAQEIGAKCAFIGYQAGRGLVRLDGVDAGDGLREIRGWLARRHGDSGRSRGEKSRLLLSAVNERAAAVLRENSRRLELLARLRDAQEAELEVWKRSDKRIAYQVMLTDQQRQQLDPLWQSVIRPAVWARESGLSLLRGRRGRSNVLRAGEGCTGADGPGAEEPGLAQRGRRYFADQLEQAAECLRSCALLSELCAGAGPNGDLLGAADEVVARQTELGDALSRVCEEAFDAFAERFEEEARALKVGTLSSGAAVIGAIVGGLITLPAGGLGVPAGAAIGAAIGASASLAGARSVYRLARLLAGTPELKAMWTSIGGFRMGLEQAQARVRDAVLDAARSRVIEPHDPLYGALDRLRAVPTPRTRASTGGRA